MNNLTIGRNIKKLRDERNITQQQLADALGVTYQAVSKWECGTTLPDIAILPVIANYFDITIDELFKPNMMAYRNKAERLMAIYESDIENSDAFESADREYRKLIADNNFTVYDMGNYAYLNDCRARYYIKIAEKYYRQAIKEGSKVKDEEYYRNERQYTLFLSRLGRIQENIKHHLALLEQEPDNPMNYSSLVCAYKCAGDFDNAIRVAEKGLKLFPNDAILLNYAGDTYKRLGKYDEAIECWDKAFEISPEMIDTRYSMVDYLIEQGQIEKAKIVLNQIIEWNAQRGYEVENKWAIDKLNKLEKNSYQ